MTEDGENYESLLREYQDPKTLSFKKMRIIDSHIVRGKTSLLDIGIGTGELIKLEKGKFDEIIGIDVDDRAIEISKKRFCDDPRVSISKADIRCLQEIFPKEKFDYVTCLDVLEHITVKDCRSALKSIYGIMKENGILLITTPGIFDKMKIIAGKSRLHRQAHTSYGWASIYQNAGFDVISVETVEFPLIRSEFLRKRLHILGKCCLVTCMKKPLKS